jgi:hypothetical protein
MARILNIVNARWYDELKAVAYYGETELEKRILQHAKKVFPQHYVFPFKKEVNAAALPGAKKPDLGLIRRDFSDWSVVEVEIEKHPLSHVLEQTRVFLGGDYNLPEMAEYVRAQLKQYCQKTASFKRLSNLFSTKAPSVLVIVDVDNSDWQEELNREGIGLCVFEVYKNAHGHYVYRTLGQYPAVLTEEAQCRPHPSIPNIVEVIGDLEFKKLDKDSRLEVSFDELLTRWEPFVDSGKRYLRLVGPANPLSPIATYGLFRDKTDRYFFKRS